MGTATLSSPWVEFFRKIQTLFFYDNEVHVSMTDDNEIQVRVDNQIKADALAKLLPSEKTFGNVTVRVTVIPSNAAETKADLIRNALHGNPVVRDIAEVESMFGVYSYVMFAPEVAQYFNDNMMHPDGITTTLYQELAKDLFGADGNVFFCTEDARDAIV